LLRWTTCRVKPSRRFIPIALEQLAAKPPYRIEVVTTNNGLIFTMRYAFRAQRQFRLQQSCRSLAIAHWRARPRHPRTSGRVERVDRTLDDECFAVYRPRSSRTPMQVLEEFLRCHNHRGPQLRRHDSTPVQRHQAYFQQAPLWIYVFGHLS
jgi:hypothetical protein